MDDQDFGRDGEASSSHPDTTDAPEFIASMETLALVGSVLPFARIARKTMPPPKTAYSATSKRFQGFPRWPGSTRRSPSSTAPRISIPSPTNV